MATQAERTAVTTEKLLGATVTSLIERGYRGTSTPEVCRRAGVSRGAQLASLSEQGVARRRGGRAPPLASRDRAAGASRDAPGGLLDLEDAAASSGACTPATRSTRGSSSSSPRAPTTSSARSCRARRASRREGRARGAALLAPLRRRPTTDQGDDAPHPRDLRRARDASHPLARRHARDGRASRREALRSLCPEGSEGMSRARTCSASLASLALAIRRVARRVLRQRAAPAPMSLRPRSGALRVHDRTAESPALARAPRRRVQRRADGARRRRPVPFAFASSASTASSSRSATTRCSPLRSSRVPR